MPLGQFTNAKKITPKQYLFIKHYVETLNAGVAAKLAGYRGNANTLYVYGHELLKHPLVRAEIETVLASQVDAKSIAEFPDINRQTYKVGFVYLIREPFGRVKIGKAVNYKARLNQLNTSAPYGLELITALATNDMTSLESELHSRYAGKRVRGEWFELTDIDVAQIIEQYG